MSYNHQVMNRVLAGIAASLAVALPARGAEVPFTERVISTTAGTASSVFATDVDGDGDTDVLSASFNKIAWYQSDGGSPPVLHRARDLDHPHRCPFRFRDGRGRRRGHRRPLRVIR